MNEFSKVAPYLKHPLVLTGFILFLAAGIISQLIKKKIFTSISGDQTYNFLKNIPFFAFVLGIIAIVLGFSFKFYQLQNSERLKIVSTTVIVHEKIGNTSSIFKKGGQIIMDIIGKNRVSQSIDDKGQAIFKNLQIGDRVKLNIVFSEPYQPIYPDSIYVIRSDTDIDFFLTLEGVDQVKGTVIYKDKPLPGVIVKLVGKTGNLIDTTDLLGDYNITIPDSLQQNEGYTVWFIAKHCKTVSATAYPQGHQPLNISMEKE